MKSVAFWVVMSCSLKSALGFVGKYDYHIQGRKVSQSKKQNQVTSLTTAVCFLDLTFDTEGGSDLSPNFRDLSELRRATIHKIVLLILNIMQLLSEIVQFSFPNLSSHALDHVNVKINYATFFFRD